MTEPATNPDAECWCPDANLETHTYVDYCPRHSGGSGPFGTEPAANPEPRRRCTCQRVAEGAAVHTVECDDGPATSATADTRLTANEVRAELRGVVLNVIHDFNSKYINELAFLSEGRLATLIVDALAATGRLDVSGRLDEEPAAAADTSGDLAHVTEPIIGRLRDWAIQESGVGNVAGDA